MQFANKMEVEETYMAKVDATCKQIRGSGDIWQKYAI
jgi:hypothetical protein